MEATRSRGGINPRPSDFDPRQARIMQLYFNIAMIKIK
jgi:hypothetical protein